MLAWFGDSSTRAPLRKDKEHLCGSRIINDVLSRAIVAICLFLCCVFHSAKAVKTPLGTVALINVGGEEYTDSEGNTWEGDSLHEYYQAGATFGERQETNATIFNTLDEVLFQTERFWKRNKAGPYLYVIPVPAPGEYTIDLHFAEFDPLRAEVGKRVVDIWIEGLLVYSDFDIVQVAGAAFTAVTISTNATVVDNTISIELKEVQYNPKLSAISIYGDASNSNAPSKEPTPFPSSLPSHGPSLQQPSSGPAESFGFVQRINAGGGPYIDSQGSFWEADSTNSYYKAGGSFGKADQTSENISNTDDDPLYQQHRWFRRNQPSPYMYEIPVPVSGSYRVELYFAEVDPLRVAGKRIVDVWIGDELIFPGFDIFVEAGGLYTATTISATVMVTSGSIVVELKQVKYNPLISAIAIYSIESSHSEQPLVSTRPSTSPSLSIQPSAAASMSGWQQVETTGDLVVRHEACFVMVGSKAYLIGGRKKSPVNVYDPSTRQWTKKKGPGLKLHHMQCVAADDKIWIVSAWMGNCCNEQNVAEILIFDTVTNIWSNKTGLPEERQRGGGAAVLYGREIYVVAGNRGGHGEGNGQALAWVDKYNIDTDQWTTNLTDAPHARDHTGGGIVDGKLCVAGGRDSGAADYFNATILPTDCYNFTTDQWEVQEDIPQGRAGAAYGTTCDGKLMVAGGEGYGQAFDRVDIFDGTSWQTVNSLETARHGTGLAVDCVCNQIHIASGSGAQGGNPELNTTETLFPSGVDVVCP